MFGVIRKRKIGEESYSVKISSDLIKKFVYMYIVYHIYRELIYQTYLINQIN